MDLQLLCLYDSQCAPAVFQPTKESTTRRNRKEQQQYSCKLHDVSKVQQLMVFVQGHWPEQMKNKSIQVTVAGSKQSAHLCSLGENSRFFQITKDGTNVIPASGKATLLATLSDGESTQDTDCCDSISASTTKNSKDSNSPSTDIGTTSAQKSDRKNEVDASSKNGSKITAKSKPKRNKSDTSDSSGQTSKSPKPSRKGAVTPSRVPLTEHNMCAEKSVLSKEVKRKQTMQELNENTPEMNIIPSSPFTQIQKKREREEETTPKPKSRKHKVSMKTLAEEQAAGNTQTGANGLLTPLRGMPSLVEAGSGKQEGQIIRCVDLSARTPKPSQRWGHTMTFVNKNQVVLIGGQGEKQLSRDSIWTLDPEIRSWKCSEVVTEGAKPEYRVGHTATYDPTMRCIYIYGGSKNSKWFHDVHMFDLDNSKWTLVKTEGKAPTRAYHSSTLWRHELWVFGGVFPRPDPQPDGCDNEIHIFSPVMESWYMPIVTGEKPRARSGHSATLLNDMMVVFGGWDFPYCYNDVCILDLTTVDWSTPTVLGVPPKPRSWHASCALTQNRVFIHGGYDGDNALHDSYIFDLDSKSWTQLSMSRAPSARAGHVAIFLPSNYENQDEDEVVVFGGGDNDGCYFSDMLSFYIPFQPKIM